MSNNSAPAAPDYSPIADASKEASREQMALSREQFAWAKQTYNDNKATTDRVVDAFMATQTRNDEAAIKDRARYEQIYQPLEDSLAEDASSYASDERKDLERGRAIANVSNQFEAARTNAQRDLEAFGVDPSSTRFAALDIGARAQEAATKAAAANQSDMMVDATGRALRSEAINVGRGYPGQVAQTYNTALQSGTGAVNNNLSTTASGANTMGTGTQWAGAANQSLNSWNSALTNGYNAQLGEFKANQESSSGAGAALGAIAGIGMTAMGAPAGSGFGKLTSKLFAASGGAIEARMADNAPRGAPPVPQAPAQTDGGAVPVQLSPTGGKALDDVPAALTVGEFIVPKDTVAFKGTEFFYKLIEKSKQAEDEMKQSSGAIPSVHPGAMKAPASRQALQVR